VIRPLILALAAAVQSPTGPAETLPRPRGGSLMVDDDYPAEALRLRQEGTARVELTISARGKASDCKVVTSSGSPILDRETCRMMTRWPFEPARDGAGKKVAGTFATNFTWTLPAR
jgi:protein TonB